MTGLVKRIVLILALASVVIPVVGCGVGTTVSDNNRSIARTWDHDARMLVSDLGELVMAERPFHGHRYPIK
jgi:hypothetical protein